MPIGVRVTDLPAAAGALDDDDEFLSLEDGSLRRATRTQAGPVLPYVDVRAYGAVGDGATDDTAAFLTAIAGAQVDDKVLFVPQGFVVGIATGTGTTAVQITAPVNIEFAPGAGMKAISGDRAIIEVAASDVSIKGGTFDGNGLVGSALGVIDIIPVGTASNVTLDGCTITDSTNLGYGVRAERIDGFKLHGLNISGRRLGISAQADAAGSDGCTITDCTIDVSGSAAAQTKAIGIDGTASNYAYDGVHIANNTVRGPGIADSLGIEVWRTPSSPTITGNDVDGFAYGISVAVCMSPAVTGNTIRNAVTFGIESADCRYPSIVGNTVKNGRITVNSGATSAGVALVGNTIDEVPLTAGFHAIHTVGVPDVTIVGNTILSKHTGAWGIYLQSVTLVTVVGNTIDGDTALYGAMSVAVAAATTAKGTITGNTIRDVSTIGVQVEGAGTDDVTVWANGFDSSAGTELSRTATTVAVTRMGSSRTAADFGQRYVELVELGADAAAPAANGGRLYLKDNGSGKTQLCVRFATGAVAVLATEP